MPNIASDFWHFDDLESRLTAPVSERMLALAGLQPGMRVLDVCCGTGEPALRASAWVRAGGQVVGIDTNGSFLARARQRSTELQMSNIAFQQLDVALHDLRAAVSGSFHVATCRWGLMYVADPIAALQNLRTVMHKGGRLVAALWAEPEHVSWASFPREVTQRFAALSPFVQDAPGPFRFASPQPVQADFARSGWSIVHSEEVEAVVVQTETAREMVHWIKTVLKHQEYVPVDLHRDWETAMEREAAKLRVGGKYQLGGRTRIVVAVCP